MRSFKQRFAVVAAPVGTVMESSLLARHTSTQKSSFEATLSPVIESIGRYCLLREPEMRQSRRMFLARLGAVALAVQARSFHALGSTADRLAWQREAKFGMFIHWGPYSVAGVEASWPIMTPTGEISEAEYRG